MINKIWTFFIIISIIYGIMSGRVAEINTEIIETPEKTINFFIIIFGTMCLWNGIMQIAKESKIIKLIKIILKPFIKIVFPNIKENTKLYNDLVGNIFANLLGLGNAATILGLKCIEEMKNDENTDVLNKNMCMLIIINTASFQLIPTTIIAIRKSYGSIYPNEIIIPVWIVTIISMTVAIILGKIFIRGE